MQARLAKLPKRVALKALLEEAEIVKFAPEAKHLSDTIKMLAYGAETALVRCLTLNGVRTEDEGRALVREMLLSSADIVPMCKGIACGCACIPWLIHEVTKLRPYYAKRSTHSSFSIRART